VPHTLICVRALLNVKKITPYTPAGIDLTTHCSRLLGGRRRLDHAARAALLNVSFVSKFWVGVDKSVLWLSFAQQQEQSHLLRG
jgi:hypothetical protein